MNQQLQDRLNQIPDKILSTEFLQSQGLGNEIGFWIFDYDPTAELEVREYITFLKGMLDKKHSHLKVAHINLLQSLVDYLGDRGFVEKAKRRATMRCLRPCPAPCTWTNSPHTSSAVSKQKIKISFLSPGLAPFGLYCVPTIY